MSTQRFHTPTRSSTPVWLPGSRVEHLFITRARSVLTGGSTERGPLESLSDRMSDDYIQSVLTELAESGNSRRPVAARLQTHPERVAGLLQNPDSIATQSARRGVVYKLSARPGQQRRPRPMSLPADQSLAVEAEIARLFHTCDAIEVVGEHDGDKALRTWSQAYEKQPFPRGKWPREDPVPILDSDSAVERHNREQMSVYRRRRARGLPMRDFESAVFCVAKSDGGYRLCTDYREFNKYSARSKFQMEGVQDVVEMIQRYDYAMLVDLKDCYLTLGLHPSHRKYCRFRSPATGTRYQWKTVSFGTAEAPQVCTKILRPLIQILKSLNIRCLIYIDDLLILDQDRVRLAKAMGIAMQLLQQQCGLQLKISKGQLSPQRKFQCLGFIWDSTTMSVSVPAKRVKATQHTAQRILTASASAITPDSPASTLRGTGQSQQRRRAGQVPTRDLGRFVGQAVSTNRAIRPAKRRLLYIQHALAKAVRKGGWNGFATISPEARSALSWWTTEEVWKANGNEIVPPIKDIQMHLRTDAATSNAGYGGVLTYEGRKFTTQGFLTRKEQDEIWINEFEFSGFELSLRSLLPQALPDKSLWHKVHVTVELDNTAAIHYARVAVSRSLQLSQKGAAFFDWRESHGISVTLSHLAGLSNIEADQLSRRQSTHIDWRLDVGLFWESMSRLQVRAKVDLFASAANTQLQKYFSFQHDHRSLGTDALCHSWQNRGPLYAYPPPILIGRVLQKVRTELCESFVLVAPVWMAQTWWPTLIEMMRSPPLLLPNERWVTTDQMGTETWPCKWPLAVWHLSGNLPRASKFRQRHLTTAGRATRTAIQHTMTGILKHSGSGTSLPTQMLSSVLQGFGLV